MTNAIDPILCQAFGHDPNPNDWGYGGGTHVDVWCRRCKVKLQVPADEWPEAKAMWADAMADNARALGGEGQ